MADNDITFGGQTKHSIEFIIGLLPESNKDVIAKRTKREERKDARLVKLICLVR